MLHMVKWDFGAFRSPRRFASDMKALFPTDIPHDPQDNMWNREMVKGFSKRALYEKLPFSEPSINEPEITPMAYEDIPAITKMTIMLTDTDPLQSYVFVEPDKKRHKFTAEFTINMQWWNAVYTKTGFTINNGQSIISRTLAPEETEKTRTRMDKFVDAMMRKLLSAAQRLNSKERQKRWKEVGALLSNGAKECLGDRVREMFEISGLMTHPDHRGKGYASALVLMVTTLADEQGRATWLASSNRVNLAFYHSLGFHTVHTVWAGKENPNWKGEPIPVDFMIREPQRMSEKSV